MIGQRLDRDRAYRPRAAEHHMRAHELAREYGLGQWLFRLEPVFWTGTLAPV